MDAVIGYYKKALSEAKKVDTVSLDQHYPGFGYHFKNEFAKGLELYVQSSKTHDLKTFIESQKLLDTWGNWYETNIDDIRGK